MSDIRINKKRMPALQSIDTLGALISRIEALGQRNNTSLTRLIVNGRQVDLESPAIMRLKLDREDTVEARMESAEQLSHESLQVAQEMAELLVFDLKVVTLHLWDNLRLYEKSLETLLGDCKMLLTLASRPIDLLGCDVNELPAQAEACLRQLDCVANHIEDAVLLAVNSKNREACQVLVARVLPAIERWLSLTVPFAELLEIDRVELPAFANENSAASVRQNG